MALAAVVTETLPRGGRGTPISETAVTELEGSAMKHTFVFHAHLTIFSYFEFRQRTSPGPLWLFCLCHWSFAGAMILTIFFFIFNE